jgi:hypothetical protein
MINDHGPSAFKIIPHWFHKASTPTGIRGPRVDLTGTDRH